MFETDLTSRWEPFDNYPVHGRHRLKKCRCHQFIGWGWLADSDWAKRLCRPCRGLPSRYD